MTLRPEQIRALSYARRQGSQAPCESIRAKIRRTFAELEAMLEAVPADRTAVRPTPGRWSLHQIVDHLIVSHRPAVTDLASLVAGESPSEPIPAGLTSEDPYARSWPLLLEDLRAVHQDFLQVLDTATDDTPLTARGPILMVVKCATADGGVETVEWVESFDWKATAILFRAHTLEHVEQIRRTLAAVGSAP